MFCNRNNVTSGGLALGHKLSPKCPRPNQETKQLRYVHTEVRKAGSCHSLHTALWLATAPMTRHNPGALVWVGQVPSQDHCRPEVNQAATLNCQGKPCCHHSWSTVAGTFFKGFYKVPKEKLLHFPLLSHFKLSFQARIGHRKENKLSHQIQQTTHKINFQSYKNRLKVS